MLRLETPRLVLREWKRTDWRDVQEYASDPEVVKYMEWGPNTVDDTMNFIDTALEQQRSKPRLTFEFAVMLKESGKVIGACGFRLLPYDLEQAAVGYCFNRNYWRQGFASEACSRVIEFGFKEKNMHRIHATCDEENVGSAAVLSKCGMRKEGHFVRDKKIREYWRDTLLFAILREEWEELNLANR